MIDKDFKTKIKTFSNKELLEQIDFMTEGYYSDLIEICLEELRCRLEATEWHYPSKGEYPPMDKKVYLWTKGDDFPVVAKRHNFKRQDEEWSWDCYWGTGFILKHNDERIIAWQDIIPPKEVA